MSFTLEGQKAIREYLNREVVNRKSISFPTNLLYLVSSGQFSLAEFYSFLLITIITNNGRRIVRLRVQDLSKLFKVSNRQTFSYLAKYRSLGLISADSEKRFTNLTLDIVNLNRLIENPKGYLDGLN